MNPQLMATSPYLEGFAEPIAVALSSTDHGSAAARLWKALLVCRSKHPLFPDLEVAGDSNYVRPGMFNVLTFAIVRTYGRALIAATQHYTQADPVWPTTQARGSGAYRPEPDLDEWHCKPTAAVTSLFTWGRQMWRLQLYAQKNSNTLAPVRVSMKQASTNVFLNLMRLLMGESSPTLPVVRFTSARDMIRAKTAVASLASSYLAGDELEDDATDDRTVSAMPIAKVIRACLEPDGPYGIGPQLLSGAPFGPATSKTELTRLIFQAETLSHSL